MAALPPYLFSNQVKHKANTLVLPSMINPVSKNRRHENKTDTKRIPSPPKESKSPKSKEKSYVCVWDKILADDGEILEPGSKKIGLIGTSGLVPVGCYKDEKKSAETFREINGTRYSFPGDYAKLASDGTITLLGRGSNCINSAGEDRMP